MKRLTLLLMASVAMASAAFATTYVRVEKDGSKTYSDRPLPGGQPVELQGVQTYSAPPATPNPNLPAEQRLLQGIDDFKYDSCALSPPKDETFVNPESVAISVSTSPPLRPGDVVNFTVNGRPMGSGQRDFLLSPVERGSHLVQVSIKDGYGREVCNSTTEFHVRRPSLYSPGRRG
jgi:Domain of unknown function (DUF4124)